MNFFATVAATAQRLSLLRSDTPRWFFEPLPDVQLFPPRAIEWNWLELSMPNWPAALNDLRIVHLSDFHLRRRWPHAYDALLDRLHDSPPDLLLLTGDFVDSKRDYRPAMPNVRRLVDGLSARIGIFAIHGNHDDYRIGRELVGGKIQFLDGRQCIVETAQGAIEFIGLPGRRRRELTRAMIQAIPPPAIGVPRIVLSHFPDHLKRTGGLGASLFLAGHTHGGQICLPGGHPLMWHDSLPRKLCRGAHRVGDTWLVVSRGFGYTGLPLRAYAAPEVIEIVCRSGS